MVCVLTYQGWWAEDQDEDHILLMIDFEIQVIPNFSQQLQLCEQYHLGLSMCHFYVLSLFALWLLWLDAAMTLGEAKAVSPYQTNCELFSQTLYKP